MMAVPVSLPKTIPSKVNLLGYDLSTLSEFMVALGEKPYRAVQILKWIHQFGMDDLSQMSNISLKFREKLAEISEIKVPEIVFDQLSTDGTRKWLLRLEDGNCIETVFIPEQNRGTLCVSSQVGCALDCGFCATAKQGFNRNLSSAEIIAQLWVANKALGKTPGGERIVSNVVFMGMGEPLLNFDNVVRAINIMLEDNAYGLSKRRVTISTAGVVPALKRLREVCDVSIAISLHAPNDELRDQLVPINKKYPIRELIDACRHYFEGDTSIKKFTIEYVMLAGINDRDVDAKELVKLFRNFPCKFNLIPFNPFPGTDYKCSSPEVIERFSSILQSSGYITVRRKTRGDDIDAACGQLAGKVIDKTRRTTNQSLKIHTKRHVT